MSEQLHLNLDFDSTARPQRPGKSDMTLKINDLRKAVVAWLAAQQINGLALDVPTRMKRIRADVAGFWNKTMRSGKVPGNSALYVPCQTIVVQCHNRRSQCWPDSHNSTKIFTELLQLKEQKSKFEDEIRHDEPHLRETSSLFDEFSHWHYERSTHAEYPKLLQQISKAEAAVYKGTRFEALGRSGVADFLYLAVPENLIQANELATGWGLLSVKKDFSIEVILKAKTQICNPANRFHLTQNIASENLSSLLLSLGIHPQGGKLYFLKSPRRRRIKPGTPAISSSSERIEIS